METNCSTVTAGCVGSLPRMPLWTGSRQARSTAYPKHPHLSAGEKNKVTTDKQTKTILCAIKRRRSFFPPVTCAILRLPLNWFSWPEQGWNLLVAGTVCIFITGSKKRWPQARLVLTFLIQEKAQLSNLLCWTSTEVYQAVAPTTKCWVAFLQITSLRSTTLPENLQEWTRWSLLA